MSPFKETVIRIIRMIPYGRVASYGQVALYAGLPRAAREVGWILHGTEGENLPWWRVINKEGRITIDGGRYNDKQVQKKLLEAEHIEVTDDLQVDMKKYRWELSGEEAKKLAISEAYLKMIIQKYQL